MGRAQNEQKIRNRPGRSHCSFLWANTYTIFPILGMLVNVIFASFVSDLSLYSTDLVVQRLFKFLVGLFLVISGYFLSKLKSLQVSRYYVDVELFKSLVLI